MSDSEVKSPVADLPSASSPGGFLAFWGVRHSPFFGRADVPAAFLLENQRNAAARVLIAAQDGAPVVTIGGPGGVGLTLLAKWLYEALPEASHHAMLLAPGGPGTEPAALTTRIAAFGASRLGVAMATMSLTTESMRDQMITIAPVLDVLRRGQKRLAIIFDNAGLLSGEPWASYILSVIRQGELIDGVLQFFLFGHETELQKITSSWPRALDARTINIALLAPSEADQRKWLEHRIILAGSDDASARKIFSNEAAKEAISGSGNNLTKLGRIAEAAMIEAFMASSRQVESRHVAIALGHQDRQEVSVSPLAVRGTGLLDLLKPI